jgi:hypothetical protein
VLGQAIDQQAEHHEAPQGDDPLGLLEEDRRRQEQRVFEAGEAALDASLAVRVDADECLVRQHLRV